MSLPEAVHGPKTLAELDADLESLGIRGQWHVKDEQFADGPRPAGVPYLWRWADIRPRLIEACEVMPDSSLARRNFSFFNPGLNWRGTTQTLMMGMQIAIPGEVAWAHRHSMGAVRFAVEGGPGLYTVVDGEPLTMETHDLVLTPGWSWHDHHNEGAEVGIWLDVLDVPLVLGLNQPFFEPYGQIAQTRRADPGEFRSRRAGMVRPAWEQPLPRTYPLRYPWADVKSTIDAFSAAEADPYDGLVFDYVDPVTGGPTLPTLACSVQILPPGFDGLLSRRTTSAVCHVIEGEGATIAGDQEIAWGPKDSFALPNWTWTRHVNRSRTERAILFCVTDRPVLEAFGLVRQQPESTRRPPPAIPARQA